MSQLRCKDCYYYYNNECFERMRDCVHTKYRYRKVRERGMFAKKTESDLQEFMVIGANESRRERGNTFDTQEEAVAQAEKWVTTTARPTTHGLAIYKLVAVVRKAKPPVEVIPFEELNPQSTSTEDDEEKK